MWNSIMLFGKKDIVLFHIKLPTLSSKVLNVTNRANILHICEGFQQQQPIVIRQCFMDFTQSSGDHTILYYLKSVTVY